jgi:hypothetical protein
MAASTRGWTLVRRFLKTVGWALFSVLSLILVALTVLSVSEDTTRRLVNGILSSTFRGQLEIQKIEDFRLDRVQGMDVVVRDPDGKIVAEVHDVSADLPIYAILRQPATRRTLFIWVNYPHIPLALPGVTLRCMKTMPLLSAKPVVTACRCLT